MLEQPTQEATQPTPDQIDQIKVQLSNYSQTLFRAFTDQLRQFPVEQGHLKQAFIRLDEGMFWFREAIAAAVVKTKPIGEPQAIVPPAPLEPVAPVDEPVADPQPASTDELPPAA